MTTSLEQFFPENRHFAQNLCPFCKDNPRVSIVSWLFKIYLRHLSFLDYLVPDPMILAQDSKYFQSHDTLCLFESRKLRVLSLIVKISVY